MHYYSNRIFLQPDSSRCYSRSTGAAIRHSLSSPPTPLATLLCIANCSYQCLISYGGHIFIRHDARPRPEHAPKAYSYPNYHRWSQPPAHFSVSRKAIRTRGGCWVGVSSMSHQDGKTAALGSPIQHYGVITLLVTPIHHLPIEILMGIHSIEGE